MVTVGPESPTTSRVVAGPATCFWGYLDPSQPPIRSVAPGDVLTIEAVTHHVGDAPDLLMDAGIDAIWQAIPEESRGPGVHIMTGPVGVDGAVPGTTLAVDLLDLTPRLSHGSNCAAHWGR